MAGAKDNRINGHANGTPSSAAAKYDLPSHFIGGSHLEVAQPGKVKDFVAAHGGHTVITNVCICTLNAYTHFRAIRCGRVLTVLFSAGAHRKQRYCSS